MGLSGLLCQKKAVATHVPFIFLVGRWAAGGRQGAGRGKGAPWHFSISGALSKFLVCLYGHADPVCSLEFTWDSGRSLGHLEVGSLAAMMEDFGQDYIG